MPRVDVRLYLRAYRHNAPTFGAFVSVRLRATTDH